MSAARKAKSKAKSKRSKSMAEEIDAELAESARKKRSAGEKPTRDELAALKREENRVDRESLLRHIHEIPKTVILDQMGVSTVQAHRLADSYGVPLRGRTASVREILIWIRDFLTANRGKLADDLTRGPATASLDRLRAAQAAKVERQNEWSAGNLIPRREMRLALENLAHFYRDAHSEIIRLYGEPVREILEEARGRAMAYVDKFEQSRKQPEQGHGNE